MAKHRSPCKVRYDANNPAMTIRLTKDLREVLDVVRGEKKPSTAAREIIIGKLEPAKELAKELAQAKEIIALMERVGYMMLPDGNRISFREYIKRFGVK